MNIQTQVSEIIRSRRTWKILAESESPLAISSDRLACGDDVVRRAVLGWCLRPISLRSKNGRFGGAVSVSHTLA